MKYINTEVLRNIQSKFSSFGKLLLRDEQMRKESVTAHTFRGMGPDVDSKVARPWKKLPSIMDFGIELRPLDWLFLLFGLEKRSCPKLVFKGWKNSPANRYIDYMFRRLRKQVEMELYEEAQKTMWILMKSPSYKAAMFNKIMRNWHREYELWQIEDWLKEITILVNERATNIDYKRVYLEEPSKAQGWRPLGVPTVPFRVYLSMYNALLTEWRAVSDSGKQHGYFHGRGVISAWNQVIGLLKEPNIVEIDFKGFFDNITHEGLNIELGKIGLPATEVSFINNLNKSVVKLPDDLKLEESRATLRAQNWPVRDMNMEFGMIPWGHGIVTDLRKLDLKLSKRTVVEDRARELLGLEVFTVPKPERSMADAPEVIKVPTIDEFLKEEPEPLVIEGGVVVYSEPVRSLWEKKAGVPQGAPTSPGLATLVLRPLEKIVKAVWYADDGLYFPKFIEGILETVNMPNYGVISNEKKFVVIKKNGIWKVKSFKFLGIRYFTPQPLMRGEDVITLWALSVFIDIWFLSLPIFSSISLYITKRDWGMYSPGRFEADTRNGATLKFTTKEAFLSYLYKARNLMLDSNYFKKSYFFAKPLSTWLLHNHVKFVRLKWKDALLFNNELTGWLTSRMYLNSWSMRVKQNFKLTYKPFSWMSIRWPIYAEENGLDYKTVTVFTASSFACHDLMDIIKNPGREKERIKKSFRYVWSGQTYNDNTKLHPRQWLGILGQGYRRREENLRKLGNQLR